MKQSQVLANTFNVLQCKCHMKFTVTSILLHKVSGDDESGIISLTPLQTLARDLRVLLHAHGKITLSELERLFYEHFCVEIKPALYGFPTLVALLMAIPHVVSIKGRGNRRVVHLSGDLQGNC